MIEAGERGVDEGDAGSWSGGQPDKVFERPSTGGAVQSGGRAALRREEPDVPGATGHVHGRHLGLGRPYNLQAPHEAVRARGSS